MPEILWKVFVFEHQHYLRESPRDLWRSLTILTPNHDSVLCMRNLFRSYKVLQRGCFRMSSYRVIVSTPCNVMWWATSAAVTAEQRREDCSMWGMWSANIKQGLGSCGLRKHLSMHNCHICWNVNTSKGNIKYTMWKLKQETWTYRINFLEKI